MTTNLINSLPTTKVKYQDDCNAYSYYVGHSWSHTRVVKNPTKDALEKKIQLLNVNLPANDKEAAGENKRDKDEQIKKPVKWSDEEIKMLKKGIRKFGFGSWAKIYKEYPIFAENGRNKRSITDKARSYRKANIHFAKFCEKYQKPG